MTKSYENSSSLENDDLCCSHCEQFVDSEDELTECDSCGYYKVCEDCLEDALDDENLCPECQDDEDDMIDDEDRDKVTDENPSCFVLS